MICNACGTAEEIHYKRLETILDEWKARAHFSISRQTVELVGTCEKCDDVAR